MSSAHPLCFIHTADWQLGLRARFIPGDAGAVVRDARLRTIQRIGALAAERGAAFVVVAGDVFEHHGLRPATVRRTFDVLREFSVPVYLLPGNHDPYTPDALYRSELWRRECPENVVVLASSEPVPVREDAWLLPCPILERQVLEDPTAHLSPSFGPQGGYRVGVAHGGIREILDKLDDDYDAASAVSLDTCERGALDYLALGDWHGLLRIEERIWYPGTPEATRFKERDPGKVLVVTVPEPGATPVVQAEEVQSKRWLRLDEDLDGDEGLDALAARLEAVPNKQDTLVELRLAGTLDLEQRARLDEEIVARAEDRFCWTRLRDERLATVIQDEDLDAIAEDGWVKDVVSRLCADSDEDAAGALRLLYRLNQEVSA